MDPYRLTEKSDQEIFKTENEQDRESKWFEETAPSTEMTVSEAFQTTESSKQIWVEPVKNSVELVKDQNQQIEGTVQNKSEIEDSQMIMKNLTQNERDGNKRSEENKGEEIETNKECSEPKNSLIAFPAPIVTKSVPGSNDVNIEIDSNSLLDRVILYSLKNTVVDNSRLDAAKNKYILNNKISTKSLNGNSNESESYSSKSVELNEEFKGGFSKANNEISQPEKSPPGLTSDISNESSNGASKCVDYSYENLKAIDDNLGKTEIEIVEPDEEQKKVDSIYVEKSLIMKKQENEDLDFIDKKKTLTSKSCENKEETSTSMLDLRTHREDRSVPPIKRNHALYVGLPDFSKQILTAPTVNRSTTFKISQQTCFKETHGPPKIRNPDFSSLSRNVTNLQMVHPDFSSSFEKSETSSNTTINFSATESSFTEIVRKNNYISDLQLKPPAVASTNSSAPAPLTSCKISYDTTSKISKKSTQEHNSEQTSKCHVIYPNMKKEGITAYNQELIVDEPMAHIINKKQYLPNTNVESCTESWQDRNELSKINESSSRYQENESKEFLCNNLRKNTAAFYSSESSKGKELNNNSQETNEFSLKHKEQQLRQEGTIITMKNEPLRTPTKDVCERSSTDLFRDYKLKQPRESPEFDRVSYESRSFTNHQQCNETKSVLNSMVNFYPSVSQLVQTHQDLPVKYMQTELVNYTNFLSGPNHHSASAPPSASEKMNPPQNWPPPRIRNQSSPIDGSPYQYRFGTVENNPINYQYPQYMAESSVVKENQQYPSFRSDESLNSSYKQKNRIQSQQFQSKSTSRSSSNYYHQNYPNFTQHFDIERKKLSQGNYNNLTELTPVSSGHHGVKTFESKTPMSSQNCHIDIHAMSDHHSQHQYKPVSSCYSTSRQPESSNVAKLISRVQAPTNHQNHSLVKVKNYETAEKSQVVDMNISPASNKSPFTNIKRESPLDLSVKTVKTKADSTGCDQDVKPCDHPESSGLKVEFTPNFAGMPQTDSRQQSQQSPKDSQLRSIPQLVPSSPMVPRKYSNCWQNNLSSSNSSNSRNYFHDRRKEVREFSQIERPKASMLSTCSQYSERPIIGPTIQNQRLTEQQTSCSPYPLKTFDSRKVLKTEDPFEAKVKSQHVQQHHLSNTATANFPASIKTDFKSAFNVESHRQPSLTSYNGPSVRDPLYYERERDRKYVEEILNRQKRNDFQSANPDLHNFRQITSPPRKRIEQHHKISSIPMKQRKFESAAPFLELKTTPNNQESIPIYGHQGQYNCQNTENHHEVKSIQDSPDFLPNSFQKRIFYGSDHLHLQSAYPQNFKGHYYPNAKSEMMHRNTPSSNSIPEIIVCRNQNFQHRPDDITPQFSEKDNHQIQWESSINKEQQATGPLQGTFSNESARLVNGLTIATQSSNLNIVRGADHNTILKLKTNLELKEQRKSKTHNEDLDVQEKKELSPRQFRTKGELKGFIPIPTNCEKSHEETIVPPLFSLGASDFDLLDWSSACNDLVQQLEIGQKRYPKKRLVDLKTVNDNIHEKSIMIPSSCRVRLDVSDDYLNKIKDKGEKSSSDEDKPLLSLLEVGKVHKSVVEKISEKISRNAREKQRLELEQKHAALLGLSSSENENEPRRPTRTAVRTRRLRKRASLGIKKTDEELSVEEQETEGEVTQNLISIRSTSKLDDLTSSDGDDIPTQPRKSRKQMEGQTFEDSMTSEALKKVESKQDGKKFQSSSESSVSDKASNNKSPISSIHKNVKKRAIPDDHLTDRKNLNDEKTMTRSKRKLEIERKLSNSKVLRNDKVVQNVLPDKKIKIETPNLTKKALLKRKDSFKTEESKHQPGENEHDSNENEITLKKRLRRVSKLENCSSNEVEEETKNNRLRPRKSKPDTDTSIQLIKDTPLRHTTKKKVEQRTQKSFLHNEVTQSLSSQIPFTGTFQVKIEKSSKFTPGWEADTYNYKRSLKVPAGLITIGRPRPGVSHSLPDLDPQTSDTSEIFSEFVSLKDKDSTEDVGVKKTKSVRIRKKQNLNISNKISSIIDLLHQRIVQSKQKFKLKKASNTVGRFAQSIDDNLLPIPEKESEKGFGFKRNIFETSIISSRTRTENNALRKNEILKEIFGADEERPKSAPPISASIDEEVGKLCPQGLSYDQKYREYLEQMNADFLNESNENTKNRDFKTSVENEDDDGDDDDDDDDDEDDDETVVASEKKPVMPILKGKVRKGRGRRCKGSSGFDYIRKKKKATQNTSENPMSVNNIIKKRLAAMENLENKDENDIGKEIKGWVLNKGVGESVLHKASRLDYVDVIAYCLDRLNMNPDPKDNAGYTPLHEACSRGHLEIARILLQYGANHSETALSGIRPLHEAIENGFVEIVRLLISYGADPCLATYSGQLPISMAEDKDMGIFLSEYLSDIDDKSGIISTWYFDGPFKSEDPSEEGFEIFTDIPIYKTELGSSVASVFSTSLTSLITATTQISDNETVVSEPTAMPVKIQADQKMAQDLIKYQQKMKRCDTNSNHLVISNVNNHDNRKPPLRDTKSCSVVLNQIDSSMRKIKKLPAISKRDENTPTKLPELIKKIDKFKQYYDIVEDADNLESDSEILELEESEAPLPPLYLLRDEGSEKWVLLTDLCNLLKVKSKDAVLKQICPLSPPSTNKELIRELKMSDFLERAICLQLFCAGEKLNVRSSKVSLVRYNDSVRNLLGVQTIRMNM